MAFEAGLRELASVIEPTLTEPLPRAADLRAQVDHELWSSVVERPLGELIEARFADDTVRGVVLTCPDRHLRLGARSVAAAEPLLPLPHDRQRRWRVEGTGRRDGHGDR